MSRFVSGERRGSILLVVIIAVIIAIMAIFNRTKPLPQALPPAAAAPAAVAAADADSANYRCYGKKKKSKKSPKKEHAASRTKGAAQQGRQRDFLNEPVAPTTPAYDGCGQ